MEITLSIIGLIFDLKYKINLKQIEYEFDLVVIYIVIKQLQRFKNCF